MRATERIALKICQYNGQRGTEKQVQKVIKSFKGSFDLMVQFCDYGKRIELTMEDLYPELIDLVD